MNVIYFGWPFDLNIGIGKSVSAVRDTVRCNLIEGKTIFSNIKLIGIDYIELTPDNLNEALDTDNAVVLLDEIHAIIFKNHRISPTCKHHSKVGLCFQLIEFSRQVRKRKITFLTTAQTLADCHFQLRTVMHEMIICEKFHVEDNIFKKCQTDNCPKEHRQHYIKQTNYRTGEILYFDPEPYYSMYDTSEIVKGWEL